MIEMHYSARNNLQPKSLHDIGHFASPISSETTSPLDSNCKKEGSFLSIEHFSMLEATRHSPNSTSTSTLSSSHHGAGSVNQFVTEMQPFAAGMDLSAEKFNIGMNEWENLLSETGGNDQTLFRWIAGGVEDTPFGLKQNGFEANVGFEEIHQSSGTQVIPTYFSSPCENNNNVNNNMLASLSCSLSISPSESTLNCNNGKFCESTVLGVQVQQQMQPQFENLEQKSRDCNNNVMVNQLPYVQCALSVNFLNPFLRGSHPDQPPTKRHNPGILNPCFGSQMEKVPLVDPHHERLLRKPKELPPLQQSLFGLGQHLNLLPAWHLPENGFMVPKKEMPSVGRNPESSVQQQDQQQQILYGQLYKAMEFILTRNFTQAQGILARLNHQLSPSIKPFQRSSLYFKEALEHVILMPNAATSLPLKIPNPFDGMLKMSAYKAFSEASPLIQFMNFTSNQALLEAVDDADCIHIIDFDIGFGAQWSSFIQELPRRKRGPPSSLKLTAFSSPSTHHTIEISLMHGSLTQFANDVGINFELEVVNFDSFDPKFYPICSLRSSDNEAIAVNLPIWSIESHLPLLPSLLCFIKQLSPKIVVSMERGCERFELPLPYHLLDALQYFEVLIDSLDAANMDPDSANKIERFLFHPKIENIVLGRLQSLDIMPSWRKLFASASFSPVGFSNFAEAQAECVTKRTHIRGFNVEKRQASLVLCWQHHELLTVSAWRC
ncbi:hypothetical protein LIER_25039 [Lithospermum erythrorhizon]|uniref:Uncharacterized protein n=1 Tax=Lithospermum erythrorhizon TaxID=34254 RepID=A0AAV3R3B5_LITER